MNSDWYYPGFLGTCSDDFYFVSQPATKRKIYYSRRTGKRTSKRNIPPNILPSIKEKLVDYKTEQLLENKKTLEEKIKRYNEELAEINKFLENKNSLEEDLIKEAEKVRQSKERKAREDEQFFERIFQSFSEKYDNPTKKHKKNQDDNILKRNGIETRDQWRKWLKENHPDKNKGKNSDICAQIIKEGKNKNW